MENKRPAHISDFACGSYTFGIVETSDFLPNSINLQIVLIPFFH